MSTSLTAIKLDTREESSFQFKCEGKKRAMPQLKTVTQVEFLSAYRKFCLFFCSSVWMRPTRTMEKEMAPHSSTLAWRILWTEEPGRLQSMRSDQSDTTERLHVHFSLSCTGEQIGNPLQYPCLEKPRDGGAWWDAVYGVAQSRTRLM